MKASKWTAEALEKEGFEVKMGYSGVPTAVRAVWGSGKPVIGLIAEYDALPEMSQKISTVKEPVTEGVPGHACGHNLMAPCCLGAAIGMKKEMEEKNLPGTIVFYGCPAEEVLTGKAFMARGGAFTELDIALSWHAATRNRVNMGIYAGLNSAKFHFKGRSSHAGGDPHNGRSALDTAELMNIGANFLREHVTDDVRIHYAFSHVHTAPNMVPDKASVWYFVRALSRNAVEDVYERIVRIAKGAALMTDTEVEVEFLGGCYNTLQNRVLSDTIWETMDELPRLEWTEEELKFAEELNRISQGVEGLISEAEGITDENTRLDNTVYPIEFTNIFGSDDVSEVEYIVPGVFFMTTCGNSIAALHTWQTTACAGHSIGMKGMLYGAKILAVSALKAIENPDIIKKAKEEFDRDTKGRKYVCPIPDEVPVP